MKEVALALLSRGGRWFLQRRASSNAVLPGRWEFPGGKVEVGESARAALARELREEVGVHLVESRELSFIDGTVRLLPFLVQVQGEPATDLSWGWFTLKEISRLPIPPANAALVGFLARLAETAPAAPTDGSDRLEASGPEMP